MSFYPLCLPQTHWSGPAPSEEHESRASSSRPGILGRMNPTSGVLSEAWELYKRHWNHLLPIAFIVYLLTALLTALLTGAAGAFGALLAGVISIVGLFWVQGALVRATEDIRDGRADMSLGDTYNSVKPKLGAITGAGLLAGLGIGLGLLLLIIPGLILLTLWVVIIPVIVLENAAAMESFGRSSALVKGYAMNVFGVIVLTFLILIGVGIVLGLLLAFFPDAVQGFLSNVISGTITAPFIVLVWTLLYYRLRDAKATGPATGPVDAPPPA